MRNAFFALLVLNLVYFAWANWVDVAPPPPVNEAIAKLPRLKLLDEVPDTQRPQPGSERTAMNPPGACLSVGPFGDLGNSAQAAALLKAKGFDPKQRAEEGQMSDGYWVYIGGMKSQADMDRTLVTLEQNGIKDALVMPETPDAGRRLSLGLYSEKSRAERRVQAVKQAGLKAELADHKLPGTLYWVDLAPPPGMNTIPLQDLFAEGVSSRISVQPCPPPQSAATTQAAAPARATRPVTPNPTLSQVAGPPKLR